MIGGTVVFLFTLLLLGVYAFFSLRRDGWRKWTGPIGFAAVMLAAIVGYGQTLGGCVPDYLFFKKLPIIAIIYDEPNAIYLWGVDGKSPMCVKLDWTDDKARGIRGQETGGDGELEFVPGNGMGKGEVHPRPVEALPPKDSQ